MSSTQKQNRLPNKPSKAWKVRQMIRHKKRLQKMAGGSGGTVTYRPYQPEGGMTGPVKRMYDGKELSPPEGWVLRALKG